jgi:hypothetical protein
MPQLRNAIRYNAVGLFLTDSPAKDPQTKDIHFFNRIQKADVSVSVNRQNIKHLGSDSFLDRKIVSEPQINVNFDYFLTDGHEESVLGLNIASGHQSVSGTIYENLREDKTAFLIIGEEPFDLTGYAAKPGKFKGCTALGLGNCYLTDYTISASVGSVAQASASMKCSNINYQCVDGHTWEEILEAIGAILNQTDLADDDFIRFQDDGKIILNAEATNTEMKGLKHPSLDLENKGAEITGTGLVFDPILYNSAAAALAPGGIKVKLENLNIGGPLLSGDFIGSCLTGHVNLQSFNVKVPFEREDLYGFESIHAYGRKMKYPQLGNISFELTSSAFQSGEFTEILCNDREYNIEILLNNQCSFSCLGSADKDTFMKLIVNNAKFDNYSINNDIGSISTVSCNFSFGMSKSEGFFMSGSYPNTKEEKCLPSTQHVPFDLDVSRVLGDVDTPINQKVHTVLDERNKPIDVEVDRV